MMTKQQIEIYRLIQELGGVASKAQIVKVLQRGYYHNASKHVGDRLSRMVNSGYLTRPKKGWYSSSSTEGKRGIVEYQGTLDLGL